MSVNFSDLSLPPHFSGMVRLFPLPNLVVFPGVVQALHVFEPRYRKMAHDCLSSDKLITMSMYRAAAEHASEFEKDPPIYEHVCICKIFAHKELEDGRLNLMIAGLKRAKIRREVAIDQPYRMAEVDVLEDGNLLDAKEVASLRSQLLKKCESAKLLSSLSTHMDIRKMLDQDIPLSLLIDLIAFVSEVDCHDRQQILELENVELRCWKMIELIGKDKDGEADEDRSSRFPPDFSAN